MSLETEIKPEGRRKKIANYRWYIATLLAVAAAISYIDRQNLPIVINELQKSISISNIQYSQLQILFLVSYGIMYAAGGKIIDLIGTKLGFALMIVWWSLANIMHGFVTGLIGLGIARFLLGLGEGGGWPAAAKAISEWFSPKERATVFGIFNGGSSIGAVIAPPFIAVIVLSLDWRWTFIIAGLIGLFWAVIWYIFYDIPSKSKYLSEQEHQLIINEKASQDNRAAVEEDLITIKWVDLFKFRKLWGLMVVKMIADSAWYFFIFWLPKYLYDARGLDIKEIGYFAWIPYAASAVGCFVGGYYSSKLISRGFSLDKARKIPLGIAAFIVPVTLLISSAPLSLALLFFSIAMFAHQVWSPLVQTLAADIFPTRVVGSVAGLMGAVGCFGGILFNYAIGHLVTNYSYTIVFIIVATMHPLSYFFIHLIVKKIKLYDEDTIARQLNRNKIPA